MGDHMNRYEEDDIDALAWLIAVSATLGTLFLGIVCFLIWGGWL